MCPYHVPQYLVNYNLLHHICVASSQCHGSFKHYQNNEKVLSKNIRTIPWFIQTILEQCHGSIKKYWNNVKVHSTNIRTMPWFIQNILEQCHGSSKNRTPHLVGGIPSPLKNSSQI